MFGSLSMILCRERFIQVAIATPPQLQAAGEIPKRFGWSRIVERSILGYLFSIDALVLLLSSLRDSLYGHLLGSFPHYW